MKNEHGVTLDLALKREAQRMAMERYGWTVDEFRTIFWNNYIDEECEK